jgi:hypothetical protein
MPYRAAVTVLAILLPVETGRNHETLRSHTLKIGEQLPAAVRPMATSSAITVTVDSVAVTVANGIWRFAPGNVETSDGGRQVFGSVAGRERPNIAVLIWRNLGAAG